MKHQMPSYIADQQYMLGQSALLNMNQGYYGCWKLLLINSYCQNWKTNSKVTNVNLGITVTLGNII